MRSSLILLSLFAIVFAAWVEVGRRVVVDTAQAQFDWENSVFLRSGRPSASGQAKAEGPLQFPGKLANGVGNWNSDRSAANGIQ